MTIFLLPFPLEMNVKKALRLLTQVFCKALRSKSRGWETDFHPSGRNSHGKSFAG